MHVDAKQIAVQRLTDDPLCLLGYLGYQTLWYGLEHWTFMSPHGQRPSEQSRTSCLKMSESSGWVLQGPRTELIYSIDYL
jgi:hypothetical protein